MGGAVVSAGTDMGVNLIDWFLITNAQRSPDVGQIDGRSQNTGVPIGFAAGGNSTKAPAAYTTDGYHLATAGSCFLTQESSAVARGHAEPLLSTIFAPSAVMGRSLERWVFSSETHTKLGKNTPRSSSWAETNM